MSYVIINFVLLLLKDIIKKNNERVTRSLYKFIIVNV